MSRGFLWVVGPFLVLLVVSLLPAHALASFTVEIIVPASDPFITVVDQPTDFEAVACADGQQLPSGEVTRSWDFGDGSEPSTENPTEHTFTEVGQYTVTITATYGQQQAQDSATAQVQAQPPGNQELELFCREGCPYPGGERIMDDIVCLTPAVCVKCPNDYELVGFWMEIFDGIWQEMAPLEGNFAPPGAAFAEYRAYWPWMGCLQNVPYRWRAGVQQTGMPPGPVEWIEHWFTRYDIVAVNRENQVLLYDPAEGSGHETCDIPWGIDHREIRCCAVHSKFSVCIKVFSPGGGLVWHTHLDNRTYHDSGTVSWSGERFPDPMGEGTAPKGIYTYRVLVANGGSMGEPETEFCQCEFLEESFRVPPIDLEKSTLYSQKIEGFHWYRTEPNGDGRGTARCLLHYTLNNCLQRTASDCFARVYGPDGEGDDLALLATVEGLDATDGTHWSAAFGVPCLLDGDLKPEGTYYAVLFEVEDEETGTLNRDLEPRPVMQDVDTLHNMQVLSVEWVPISAQEDAQYAGYVDDNPGPGGGKRIWPDYYANPVAHPDPECHPRNKIRVRVTIGVNAGESAQGVRVFLRSFDVDDPSSDVAPLDADPSGDDNRVVVEGDEAKPGRLDSTSGVTDANGQVTVDFYTNIQPGNNFRVVADIGTDGWLSELAAKHPDAEARVFDGDNAVPANRTTELLTVWRKLHVVAESMGSPTPPVQWEDDDLTQGDIPGPDTQGLTDALTPLYILPVTVEGDQDEGWSYYFNHDVSVLLDLTQDYRDNWQAGPPPSPGEPYFESDYYWQTYVLGAHEDYDGGRDNDPNDEPGNPGKWFVSDYDVELWYAETCRDLAAQHGWTTGQVQQVQRALVVHEVGHDFDLVDDDTSGQPTDSAMWAFGTDAREALVPDIPCSFSAAEAVTVRNATHP
jgi:hypothetical protein